MYCPDISERCIEEKERERERERERNMKRENISREKGKRKEEIGYEKITYYENRYRGYHIKG
jgi:hypothetical protein